MCSHHHAPAPLRDKRSGGAFSKSYSCSESLLAVVGRLEGGQVGRRGYSLSVDAKRLSLPAVTRGVSHAVERSIGATKLSENEFPSLSFFIHSLDHHNLSQLCSTS